MRVVCDPTANIAFMTSLKYAKSIRGYLIAKEYYWSVLCGKV
jgi:hypothetical protein